MTQIGIFFSKKDLGPIEPLQRARGEFLARGFEVDFIEEAESSPREFDLIVAQQSQFGRAEVERANRIVLLERADASISWCRRLAQDPRVVLIVKGSCLADPTLNNHCSGRYHTSLIPEGPREPTRLILSEVELAKIVPGAGFGSYTVMDLAVGFSRWEVSDRREIDVNFMGTVKYGNRTEIDRHRGTALEILHKMSVKKLIGAGKPLKRGEYLQKMVESKIVVSPWGFGELCYRDFEAFLTGAILIKPESSFVKSWPDMFATKHFYVPCRPDFQDLEEVIEDTLRNYSKWDWNRNEARDLTLRFRKPTKIAEYYTQLFQRALGGING